MLRSKLSQSLLPVCAMTPVSARPFAERAYTGPCSATKDEINTLFSLSLSAVGGEADEETLGV